MTTARLLFATLLGLGCARSPPPAARGASKAKATHPAAEDPQVIAELSRRPPVESFGGPDPSRPEEEIKKRRSPHSNSAPFIWPADGVVISIFGNREGTRHDGVDIAAPIGTPVWASAAGKVLYAGQQPGYGAIVILEHPDQVLTIYAHNQRNLAREGQVVSQGEVIAQVGESGNATSPAVHFEIREHKKPVNPLSRLAR